MFNNPTHFRRRRGFTLFEIMLTLLIFTIAIIPLLNGFAPALLSSGQEEEHAVLTGQARQTMNRLLEIDFRTLDTNQGNPVNLVALFGSAAEADKETLVYKGGSIVPVVAITDAGSGKGGLLELKVSLKAVSLTTLKAAR